MIPEAGDPLAVVRARLRACGCRITHATPDGYTAQCPAHEDRSPSLKVSRGPDGQALLFCHGGCKVAAILQALSLPLSSLFTTSKVFVTRSRSRLERGKGVSLTLGVELNLGSELENRKEDWERPELYVLLEAHARGEIEPAPFRVPSLPVRANADDRAVHKDMRLLMGLRVADGDRRPLPYSTRFCCRRLGWDEANPMRASRALKHLERWGVWVPVASALPRRPGSDRSTKCYEPGLTDAQPRSLVIEAEVEPVSEVVQEPTVDGAEPTTGEDPSIAAPGD